MNSQGSGNNGSGGGGTAGMKCKRWKPTAEQVKLLTFLFKAGVERPTTEQIPKISTELSFYGEIESKNVFYWFQNQKAREKNKRTGISTDHRQDTDLSSPHRDNPRLHQPPRIKMDENVPVITLPFPVAPVSSGIPASITVAAAAKGPFVPPEDLLRNKGAVGWRGSAATSAFRPAEPRKAQNVLLSINNTSTSVCQQM